MTGEVFTRPAPADHTAAYIALSRAQRAYAERQVGQRLDEAIALSRAQRAYDRAGAAQEASDKPLLTRLKARITRRLHRDVPGVLVLPGDLYLGWSTNHAPR